MLPLNNRTTIEKRETAILYPLTTIGQEISPHAQIIIKSFANIVKNEYFCTRTPPCTVSTKKV